MAWILESEITKSKPRCLVSLPRLHYRVDTAGSYLKPLWPDCFTRVQHIQISTCIPRVEPTYWELTWCQDVVVVISSCWYPLRHPYFTRFQVVDQLRSLFKLERPCLLRYSQLSHSFSYFWMPLLEQDGWLCSPESLCVGPWEFLCSYLRPFYQNLCATAFIPVSSVPGWNLGILCEALGLPDLHPQTPPPSPSQFPKPIWRLQHYQPSSCSDTQGSSNTIVSSSPHLLSHSHCKLHLVWGWWVGKNWFWLQVLIIPDLFVLCLDISVFETPKPRIWVFCSLLQNINPALRQWILKVFE